MTTFGTLGIAGTGLTVFRKWLDAVSDNIANMNTATATSGEAFQARYVSVKPMDDGGVQVDQAVLSGNTTGRVVYEPNHPLADADGNVRYPEIDLGSQMGQLMMAQRAYQANLAVVDRAKSSYEAALQLGRNV